MGVRQGAHDERILKHTLPSQKEGQYTGYKVEEIQIEYLFTNLSTLTFCPFSPPERTVWRITLYRKIKVTTVCDHLGGVEQFSILLLEFVERIGGGGRESIAPVAQASRNLHDKEHETEACK
jgi:hypothetical protein